MAIPRTHEHVRAHVPIHGRPVSVVSRRVITPALLLNETAFLPAPGPSDCGRAERRCWPTVHNLSRKGSHSTSGLR